VTSRRGRGGELVSYGCASLRRVPRDELAPDLRVRTGTRLAVLDAAREGPGRGWALVRVRSGPSRGATGWVRLDALREPRDGSSSGRLAGAS